MPIYDLSDVIMRGTLGARPAADIPGRLYYVTDVGSEGLWRDTGVVWESVEFSGTPDLHAVSHEAGGGDEISVLGLSGLLADPQTPVVHAVEHLTGGSDVLELVQDVAILFGDGSNVISTGIVAAIPFDFPCELIGWRLGAPKEAGSIVIDVWKDTDANFPPDNADSITNGHEPSLVASDHANDMDLSDWSDIAIAAGEWLIINVDSAATITMITFALKIQRV